jgi:hypothetical protein
MPFLLPRGMIYSKHILENRGSPMPFVMTHFAVAKAITDNCDCVKDFKRFYLGAIAPDCVHVRNDYHSDMKKCSHFQMEGEFRGSENTDSTGWRENVLRQLKSLKDGGDKDFYLGYFVHILTDICDHDTVYKPFISRYTQDGLPLADRSRTLYNDKSRNDFTLFDRYHWRDEVWTMLADARGANVGEVIKTCEAETYRDSVLHQYDSGESAFTQPIKYFSLDDNLRLIDGAADDIIRVLAAL